MSDKKPPKFKYYYTNDESGVVTISKSLECPECRHEFDETEYQYHISVCKKEKYTLQTSRHIVDTRKPKTIIDRKKLVKCPYCNVGVRADRLEKHKKKAHVFQLIHEKIRKVEQKIDSYNQNQITSEASTAKLVKCPYCVSEVREDRLEKHKKRVHPDKLIRSNPRNSKSAQNTKNTNTKPRSIRSSGGVTKSRISSSKSQSSPKNEAYHQSFDEPRDGSKYWGFMRRENGRFGSFPLFDDYGDESEP